MLKKTNDREERFNKEYPVLFPVIFRVAYRITGEQGAAEDLCQEAFIKYFERHEPLPDINQAKYWLIRVVKNISLNYEKKRVREKNAVNKLEKITPQYIESTEKGVLKNETKIAVQKALDKLPYKLRVVLVLKEYAQLNYKEIGSIVGISEGNVKVRIFRARERLEKIFKEEKLYVPEG
jgi:RNA polymerase sigma factor (sigma-70 family)